MKRNKLKYYLPPKCREKFEQVISNRIGDYYYTKIIGEKPSIEEIFFDGYEKMPHKEEWDYPHNLNVGYSSPEAYLKRISSVIERFNETNASGFISKENRFIKKLESEDKNAGRNIGHQILEILSNIIMNNPKYIEAKKSSRQHLNKFETVLKKRLRAKTAVINKIKRSNLLPEEMLINLGKLIDSHIARSQEAQIINQIKKSWGGSFKKDGAVLGSSIMPFQYLFDNQGNDKGHYRTAKKIEYFLNYLGVDLSADAIRKTITAEFKKDIQRYGSPISPQPQR